MKIILSFFIVGVFLSENTFAQKIHFTDTSNVWSEYWSVYNDGYGGNEYMTYNYIGDTTINSVKYRRFNFNNGISLVREDTILNKVYIWDATNDSEVVLMDYNLNVGDTFFIYYGAVDVYKYAVTGIDSTLINSVYYKVWHFTRNIYFGWGPSAPMSPSTVIEGVGCIQDPTYMMTDYGCVECPYEYMYCFLNNGTRPSISPGEEYGYWSGPTFDNSTSCTVIPELKVSKVQPNQNDLVLSPNPATYSLNITSPQLINTVTINNVLGQMLFSEKCDQKETQINVSGFPPGVYYIRINKTETRKFVKQ